MRRELVEDRGLVTESDFREGLALAQVAPGPLAAQLAMYIGWLDRGSVGAGVVGLAFILPSLVIVLVLAWVYARAGGMPLISKLFYGVGAAVIALIARSGVRLARSTIQRDPLLWLVVVVNAAATVILRRESIPLVFASGLLIMLIRSSAAVRTPAASSFILAAPLALPLGVSLASIFFFFAASGLVVFGSGLAIIPFLHGGVVLERHWLTEQQFLDAVAISLLTPGPVVITVAFIGSLVAGLPGGLIAAAGVFLPAFLVVCLVSPHFRRMRERASVQSFASGVTAAAIGALLGAVAVMTTRTLVDVTAIAISIAALAVLVLRPKFPEPALLAAAAAAGVILR